MKIIDLLNKIANGEEVPKKIKIGGYTFEFYTNQFSIKDTYHCIDSRDTYLTSFNLNREVELIEEDKEIEEINVWYEFGGKNNDVIIYHMCTELKDKINELIKEVNELKKGK